MKKYRYFLTTEVENWWKKQHFGLDYNSKLQSYLQSNKEMSNAETLLPNLLMTALNRPGRPTFLWFRVEQEDICLYVLRRAYSNDVVTKVCNKGNKEEWRKKHELTESERTQIANYIEIIKQEDVNPHIEKKPTLSGNERDFISRPLNINQELFGITIYETEEWINSIQNIDFEDFTNAAQQIEYFIEENIYNPNGWYEIRFKGKIILLYHNNVSPKEDNWILSYLLDYYDDYKFEDWKKEKTPEERDYRRGYPYSFLIDKDEWRLMEQDKKSNLVLTQEQVDVVGRDDVEYPMFITGRAGSGKSTVLQYLFAEIILRYFGNKHTDLYLPVYLSYSDNLINDARKLCQTLFERTHEYSEKMKEMNLSFDKDIKPNFNNLFFVFQNLLKDCVRKHEPEVVNTQFLNNKHVSYAVFSNLWNKRFGKIRDAAKNYGPSISWHIIRTYIKGWNSEKLTTPEDYSELPRDNKSVKEETYKIVYEKVWKNWYSTLEEYWDDQDLVRYCLENDYAEEQYSAIFCDEAQDFTRIELDFILKLSTFANRTLDNVSDIKKLPFVFAGDEFQTLNPTGFSWENLRGYFTIQLCKMTGLSEFADDVKIPDVILFSENFRSTRQIVKLANRIQLLRATRFKEISDPQTPHFSKAGDPIFCLPPSKLVIEQLKNKEVILIIPAADGESIESFIKKTPLSRLIEFEKGAPKGITILNPTQAKGLEYPNVAVYGFDCNGPYENLKLENLLEWFENPTKESDDDIELRYQMSNAYVAVTRAGTKLYIIDDFTNSNSFWAFAFYAFEDLEVFDKIQALHAMMNLRLSYDKQKLWKEDVLGNIQKGTADNITDENIRYLQSPEHKDDLENRAKTLRDAILMRQAACRHRETGRDTDEERCWAQSFVYEEEYQRAADHYVKAFMYEEAVTYYWEAINQSLIDPNEHTLDPNIVYSIAKLQGDSTNKRVELCAHCVAKRISLRDLKLALSDILNILKNDEEEQAHVKVWEYIANRILNNVQYQSKVKNDDFSIITHTVNELKQFKVEIDTYVLAMLAYKVECYQKAIELWDELHLDKSLWPKEYYDALIKTTEYPKNIEFYEGTQEPNWYKKVLSEYKEHRKEPLNDIQRRIIYNAILRDNNSGAALFEFLPSFLVSTPNIEMWKKAIEDAISLGNNNLNQDAILAIYYAKYSLQSWIRPKTDYVSPEAAQLFDGIQEVQRIHSEEFANWLYRYLDISKFTIKDVCNNSFKKYSRQAISILVFTELGAIIESRDKIMDAIRYYEIAKTMSDDPTFKRKMDIRWIACKLKLAARYKDDTKNVADALMRMRELGIISSSKFPEKPAMNDEDWETLLSFAISISNEEKKTLPTRKENSRKSSSRQRRRIAETEKKNDKSEILSSDKINNHSIPDGSSNGTDIVDKSKKQIIKYDEYTVTYLPAKSVVAIQYEPEDDLPIMTRIINGILPDDSVFYLNNGRLYIAETQTRTPIFIEKDESVMTISIYEGDKPTNIAIKIDLIK